MECIQIVCIKAIMNLYIKADWELILTQESTRYDFRIKHF